MLSVTIHKDISDFKPKLIGNLRLRTLLCSLGAIGISVAIGLPIWFIFKIENTVVDILIMVASLPLWALGYYRPQGMDFEKFCKLWFLHNYSSSLLGYQSTPCRLSAQIRCKQVVNQDYRHVSALPAIESINPAEFFTSDEEEKCLKST